MRFLKTTKNTARIFCFTWTFFIFIGLTSCSSQIDSSNATKDFRFGVPVENDSQAEIAAQSALRASFDYAEPITVIKTEKMSYGEYSDLIKQPLNQSADLQIWAVIYFNDEWQNVSSSTGVTPYPPFRGCVYVAINADTGKSVEVGGPLNKGILTNCDK